MLGATARARQKTSENNTLCRAIAVRIARNVSETGAPEEIRTPDPQIRSLLLDQQPETGSVQTTAPNYRLRATRENAENAVRRGDGILPGARTR